MSYIYNLTDTWNAGGTTFTAVKMNVTDTASAAGSLLLDLQVGGSSKLSVTKAGDIALNRSGIVAGVNTSDGYTMVFVTNGANQATLNNASDFGLNSGGSLFFNGDTYLRRDAADTLAQRNGTNAQAFRVYNTYTDASNYERGFFRFNSSVLRIGFEAAGTGSTRAMQLMSVGFAFFGINDTNAIWNINGSGHFIAGTDNSVDIGASGANRPRNLFVGGYLSIGDGITAPGAGTGQARIYVDTADGDLKIVFADGTVKTIVTDT